MAHTSSKAIERLKRLEGFSERAYKDSVGVWTVGYGFTKGVNENTVVTRGQADARLLSELRVYERAVADILLDYTPYQFDACVLLCFNIGVEAFRRSSIVRHFLARHMKEAADAFLLYNKGTINGRKKEIKGLTTRRQSERRMFLGME